MTAGSALRHGQSAAAPRPPAALSLQRTALLLAAGVWSAFFLIRSSLLLYAPGAVFDWGAQASRVLASVCGALLCLGMHLLLRRGGHSPWKMLLYALALALPAAALLDLAGAAIWRVFSSHYLNNPQRWLHPQELIEDYLTYLWVFVSWSALYVGAANAIEVRRRDQRLAAAEAAAQAAQLLALRLQIHPHFLFNTLNSLASLIALGRNEDSEKAVLTLSSFLRHTLSNLPYHSLSLAEEVRALGEYLDLETLRFGDRLRVQYRIADDCAALPVPSLILLPLVENAIKFGLAESEDGITLTLGAARDGEVLRLWVQDDGTGAVPARGGLGLGLANVRQRLQATYGEAAQLAAGPCAGGGGGGWRSEIRIPWAQLAGEGSA
ncbi:sensor histidine kinase [Tahibacter harae]|uniref:Histidine kinase n=1 Tax=Tahibacter harae TaxID=2963937 RepID=A0ABT1QTD7_9GAMM|nr:histidine kinase [Tahibacter harae]MCQ4165539.1 histidine kinase [Tahibacter harae]